MAKSKKPGKGGRSPKRPEEKDEDVPPQTQTKADLVPPPRRPPTAVGTETPPPPSRPPERMPVEQRRPALWRVLETVRAAVDAVLDLADSAAEAIRKGLERRA